ncbi:MAG: hypothetical protein ACO201_03665 [Rickettsiales bacterium]
MKVKINNCNLIENFPEEVSKECFLYEALCYLVLGYAPIDSYYQFFHCDDEEDIRNSRDLYYGEKEPLDVCNHDLIHNLIKHKFEIEDPYFDPKYEEVNYRSNIIEYDKFYDMIYESIKNKKEELEKFKIERKLLVEYLAKKQAYDLEVKKIFNPYKLELLNLLKSGKIEASGFLVQKYNTKENTFLEIESGWEEKAATKKYDINYDNHNIDDNGKLCRVSIPKQYWKIDNVDFEESSLFFNVLSEVYKYLFVIIDFSQLHKIVNNDLIYNSEAKISKSGITYKEAQYIKLAEAESIKNQKYFNEKSKGGTNSNKKYKPLKQKVEDLCKEELKNGGYKSALKLCEVISYKIEQDFKNLLDDFEPYQTHCEDGGGWTRPTFYNWCNDFYKIYK